MSLQASEVDYITDTRAAFSLCYKRCYCQVASAHLSGTSLICRRALGRGGLCSRAVNVSFMLYEEPAYMLHLKAAFHTSKEILPQTWSGSTWPHIHSADTSTQSGRRRAGEEGGGQRSCCTITIRYQLKWQNTSFSSRLLGTRWSLEQLNFPAWCQIETAKQQDRSWEEPPAPVEVAWCCF